MNGKLAHVNKPDDLKKMTMEDLNELSLEVRDYLIEVVASNGGHLSSSLGTVELTIGLHYIFDSPRDKILWDVGHQCYTHKLLTGRKNEFSTLRQHGGISGFPSPAESDHDAFGTGHSSTSISAAIGLVEARELRGEDYKVIAVIGDGALTGGMAYEALNHAGELKRDLIVVLNDNNMSIDRNVGGISSYLESIRTNPGYQRLKERITEKLENAPLLGDFLVEKTSRVKSALKHILVPGMLFEEMGLTYLGPVDGHNIASLVSVFDRARKMEGPIIIHALTQKGKGYVYAEEEPSVFHGVGPFDQLNGAFLSKEPSPPSYTKIFGETLVDMAAADDSIVAVTAAMSAGTGLDLFASCFPERFYDVGIAEQHAVTMAGGLASAGVKPVVAVYSTFLQRAYDQVLHDLSVQKLPVVLALDRAGIVGKDGETHQGIFDISYLRHIPNFSLMAPRDENQLRHQLLTALSFREGPVAIRYPRARGEGVEFEEPKQLPWGKGEQLREGDDLLILAVGSMVYPSLRVAHKLSGAGINSALVDPLFIKPLDEELILKLASECGAVLTVEENVLAGGFGSACLEVLERNELNIPIKRLGIGDTFVKHGERDELLQMHGLDEQSIYHAAVSMIEEKAGKL